MKVEEYVKDEIEWAKKCIDEHNSTAAKEGFDDITWLNGYLKAMVSVLEHIDD